jgi:dTDP-4-dehydrorhamnose reductase
MKILILGAKGNLGAQLTQVFNSDVNEVIAWDKEKIDITDKDQVTGKIKEIQPEIIINAAAYNAVDKCEDRHEYKLAKALNGNAVGYLADSALQCNATIVHYSSDYVFGWDRKKEYKEDDKPCPINNYGRSKLQGEEELFPRISKGLKCYLIRTSKLFGPKGESEVAKPSFFDIMQKHAKEKDELEVVNEEVSCFTYTPDLAQATKDLIDKKFEHGIYHIINQGPCTWYEAARYLFKLTNKDIKIKKVNSDKFPRPAKRPKYSILLNTKLPDLRNWKRALEEYLDV